MRSYRLRYEPIKAIKGQVLAEFIADFTPRAIKQADQLEGWTPNVDRVSNSKGEGIVIVLTTPDDP